MRRHNNYGTLTVINSTLAGNSATDRYGSGGGVYNDRGTLTVTNSTLAKNSATGYYGSGGGVYNDYGTMTAADSTLSGNSANNDGGGIYNDRGTLTLDNSTLSENSADGGGAICNYGTLTITNSTLSGNSADGSGGGINCRYSSTVTLTNATFAGNSADGSGGGIDNSGTVTVINSTFSRNSAYQGGGIDNSGTLTLNNATFAGNSADSSGGGICCKYSSRLTVTNSTLSGNSADDGGGIYSSGYSAPAILNNTVVAGNAASSGPEIYHDSGTLTGSNNLIGDGSGQSSFIDGENGNLVGTSEAPVDPLFIRNPSDGGDGWGDDPDTPDIDESANDDYGDLRLRPDSPAIDAGDNALLPADEFDLDGDGDTAEPIPLDLAGNARIEDGDEDGTAVVDMGAYEYVAVAAVPGDLNNDGFVGSADLDIVRAHWGQAVSPGSLANGDPSGDGMVGSADLDVVRANWGQTTPAAAAGLNREDELVEPEVGADVYGPIAERDSREVTPSDHVFANARSLADAAWTNAVDALRARREKRESRAIDAVLLGWGE